MKILGKCKGWAWESSAFDIKKGHVTFDTPSLSFVFPKLSFGSGAKNGTLTHHRYNTDNKRISNFSKKTGTDLVPFLCPELSYRCHLMSVLLFGFKITSFF
jgi:hypothetical protein